MQEGYNTMTKKRNNKLRTFTIPDEVFEALKKRSETTGIPMSMIITGLIVTNEKWEKDHQATHKENGPLMRAVIAYDTAECARRYATSHNRQYVDEAKISVFIPEAEREPEQAHCMEQKHNNASSMSEQADPEEWDKLMAELGYTDRGIQ